MHARATYRLAVVVTAIGLVLAVQIGGAAHEAAVRHVACAQHGELIEAPDVEPVPAGDSRFVAAGSGGAHDHCAVASALRQHGTSTTSTPTLASIAVVLADTPTPCPRSLHADLSIYRLAPKTSPPDLVIVRNT